MARIGYFILAHKEPKQVGRLVNRLQTEADFFRIHFDIAIGKQRFKEWKQIVEQQCSSTNVEIVSEFRCRWGSFGGVDATLSAMQYYKDVDYDYFVNLSGECYPIKPNYIIGKAFNNQTSGFMENFELPVAIWGKGGMERLWYKHYYLSVGNHYVRLRVPRFNKKIPGNLKPYGGSAFFCLPKQQVTYILEFLSKNPSVKDFFNRAGMIDEVFFQTILMNSPFQSQINNDNKRHIDWKDSNDGHPKFLTTDNFEDLAKSEKLFARKFGLTLDNNILDLIDQKLINPTAYKECYTQSTLNKKLCRKG